MTIYSLVCLYNLNLVQLIYIELYFLHFRDSPFTIQRRAIHCSSALQINMKPPEKWLKYNDVVFPPTKEGEEERPAVSSPD